MLVSTVLSLWKQYDKFVTDHPEYEVVYLLDTVNHKTGIIVGSIESSESRTFDWDKMYKSFYNSKEWAAYRKAFLAEHPCCASCGATATTIHHRNGVYLMLTSTPRITFGYLLKGVKGESPICQN